MAERGGRDESQQSLGAFYNGDIVNATGDAQRSYISTQHQRIQPNWNLLALDDLSRSSLNAIQRNELVLGCSRLKIWIAFHMRPNMRLIKQKAVGVKYLSTPSFSKANLALTSKWSRNWTLFDMSTPSISKVVEADKRVSLVYELLQTSGKYVHIINFYMLSIIVY